MTYLRPSRGYSLLELIVSLGIFSIVMLIVMAAYVNLISLDRQARAANQLSSSLSFALETMSRTIRTGTEYDCGTSNRNCEASGGSSLTFKDSEGTATQYKLVTDAQGNGSLGMCTGSCVTTSPITDPRINVTRLTFFVQGVGVGDSMQPRVTIVVSGTMKTDAGEATGFSIQTGATQRLIEL